MERGSRPTEARGDEKIALVDMAMSWLLLAQQVERNTIQSEKE
jgi:hypothetical protein